MGDGDRSVLPDYVLNTNHVTAVVWSMDQRHPAIGMSWKVTGTHVFGLRDKDASVTVERCGSEPYTKLKIGCILRCLRQSISQCLNNMWSDHSWE